MKSYKGIATVVSPDGSTKVYLDIAVAFEIYNGNSYGNGKVMAYQINDGMISCADIRYDTRYEEGEKSEKAFAEMWLKENVWIEDAKCSWKLLSIEWADGDSELDM